MVRNFVFVAVISALGSVAFADENPLAKELMALNRLGYSGRAITPIFSQLVTIALPSGFVPAFENLKGGQYIQELVPEGETVMKWSQMITITGSKGLTSNPNVTPVRFAGNMAGGFKRVCPESYSAIGIGELKAGSHDAFAAFVSCGQVNTFGEPHSESMLLIVIKGERDYYTIQWAERADESKVPINFDRAKWLERLRKLGPIKLCPIVPGEKAPYPSCTTS